MTDEAQQPALPLFSPEEPAIDVVVSIARDAVDLERRPGFAAFTNGKVTVERADSERIVLAVDNPWAASAIRRSLLDAGGAVEGDPAHMATIVTVWPTSQRDDTELPAVAQAEERDEYGQMAVVLDGPNGTVEQQVGSGGHNDLIVHARHPFPSAVRSMKCRRHGECWMRSQPWRLADEPRRHIRTIISDTGYAWDVTSAAAQAMRALYLEYVHQTRPGDTGAAFRLIAPIRATANYTLKPAVPAQAAAVAPAMVNAIRDIADYEPTA